MDFAFTAEAGLTGLFLASFLSATLLPGGSEAVLIAVVHRHPDQAANAFLLATLGNTLGGITTYGMARLLPQTVAAGGRRQAGFAPCAGMARRCSCLHGRPSSVMRCAPPPAGCGCRPQPARCGWQPARRRAMR